MQPYFWRPDPPPQQRRPNATLPAAVGSEPPRRGPLAVAVLAATVAAWPLGSQAQVPLRDLSQVSRRYTPIVVAPIPDQPRPVFPAAIQRAWESLTWGSQHAPLLPQPFIPEPVVDPPPPRRVQFVVVAEGGNFYPTYQAIPMQLPSGVVQATQVDAPTPHVPLPPQILARWVPIWDAQQARLLTPPTGEVVVADHVPFTRVPAGVLTGWYDVTAVRLVQGGVPLEQAGDLPPRFRHYPIAILQAWVRTWDSQRAPTTDYGRLADTAVPFRPLPPQVLRAWVVAWEAQRSAVAAAWDVPPAAPGDEIPFGRRLAPSILEAWQPLFILPPPVPTFDARPTAEGDAPPPRLVLPFTVLDAWTTYWDAQHRPITVTVERSGDDPPPFVRLPSSLVRMWEQTWQAQRASLYHDGLVVPPSVAKGFLVRHESGALYRIVFDGHEFYAVRVS